MPLAHAVLAGIAHTPSGEVRAAFIGAVGAGTWQLLCAAHGVAAAAADIPPRNDFEEFDELRALLADHRTPAADAAGPWVADAIAAGCAGDNHLWQDLGLASRAELSAIMQSFFGPLAAKNSGDMKWKKFFYLQLCEQAEIRACRAPSCAVCCDYARCFGAEDGIALVTMRPVASLRLV
jgi:nitrogen fixation protein NifQ